MFRFSEIKTMGWEDMDLDGPFLPFIKALIDIMQQNTTKKIIKCNEYEFHEERQCPIGHLSPVPATKNGT